MAWNSSDSFRSTLSGGCDYVFDYCCDLCEQDGEQKEAVGYCSDCEDYLCAECFDNHLKPRPMRSHVLLDQTHMPKHPRKYTCDLCKQDDKEEEAVGYCSDCQDYLCKICFSNHLKPKPMRNHILLDQHHMPKQTQNIRKYTCDLCKEDDKEEIAVGYCSDCQDYLCTECFNHHLKPKPMRNHVLLDQHQMPKEQHKTSTSRQVEGTGLTSRSKASGLRAGVQHTRYARKTRAEHVMDINVRTEDNSESPYVTGCAVLPGDKLVIIDFWNNSENVKLIDITQNIIVSQLDMPSVVWDTTLVNSRQVAVTSFDAQIIYFLNVSDKLEIDHEVKVNGGCYGIDRINDKFVVSYIKPVKVEIVSMKGEVLQTVVPEDRGKKLFTYPTHVAVSKDQKVIYISDWDRHTVTVVALTGQVLARCWDDKMECPYGLTVDAAGTVYICGNDSNNILQMSADLTEIRELLQEADGVKHPYSVYYCETTDRLYVGMMSDEMRIYCLK